MGDGCSCTKRGRHKGRLREFLFGHSCLSSGIHMNFNAIGTLRGQCYRNGHQLLVLLRNGTVGKCSFVERDETLPRFIAPAPS